MPVMNQGAATVSVQIPVPQPVQQKPKQKAPPAPQPAPQPVPQGPAPVSFEAPQGGGMTPMRTPRVARAFVFPWSPAPAQGPQQLSRPRKMSRSLPKKVVRVTRSSRRT